MLILLLLFSIIISASKSDLSIFSCGAKYYRFCCLANYVLLLESGYTVRGRGAKRRTSSDCYQRILKNVSHTSPTSVRKSCPNESVPGHRIRMKSRALVSNVLLKRSKMRVRKVVPERSSSSSPPSARSVPISSDF